MLSAEELYIDSVEHRYGNRKVLNGVFLNCKVGEIVGVLGRNGSGKSTLLQILFGIVDPHFKQLTIDGIHEPKPYLTRKLAYLPQSNFIPSHLKIGTLVDLYSGKYREQLLAINVVRSNLKESIGNLSGGNRRLIEALLIIYSDAKYVLLDEPFSQLAPVVVEELKTHILKLGMVKGFIVTDHYYRQILAISSRVVLINQGCNYNIRHEGDLINHGYLPQ